MTQHRSHTNAEHRIAASGSSTAFQAQVREVVHTGTAVTWFPELHVDYMSSANAGCHVNDMMFVPLHVSANQWINLFPTTSYKSEGLTHHTSTSFVDLSISPRSQAPPPAYSLHIYRARSVSTSVSFTPAMAMSLMTVHQLLPVAVVMAVLMALMAQETQAVECPTNDLSSCLPAAYEDIQPTEACCTNLAAYTDTATPAECLCQGALSSPLAGDDDVNVKYAVLIPQKCNLDYPAGTTCRGYVIP